MPASLIMGGMHDGHTERPRGEELSWVGKLSRVEGASRSEELARVEELAG